MLTKPIGLHRIACHVDSAMANSQVGVAVTAQPTLAFLVFFFVNTRGPESILTQFHFPTSKLNT